MTGRVARSYIDALGTPRAASAETVARFEALLADGARTFVAPSLVLREGEPLAVDVTLPANSWGESLHWELRTEDGEERSGEVPLRDAPVIFADHQPDVTYDTRHVTLGPTLSPGSHRLALDAGPYGRASVTVIVVPPRAHPPEGRTWGIAVQIYTLRSQRNHGIGDFADLRAFCALAGDRGASYVGINPLHAGFRTDPEAASPYAASSRRWLNWLYIAVDEVPEMRSAPETARAHALRETSNVDYRGVAAFKDEMLRACYAELARDRDRRAAFDRWRAAQGEPLLRFATFETLVLRYGRDLSAWPEGFREPDSTATARFVEAERDEIGYAMYLQWLAAEQLAALADDAARHGVRLYRDLAVGVDSAAADVWADAQAYVSGVSVGAPPDALNTLGQDWGLPPLDPRGLVREAYAELIALLEANMREAGALRIDHAMSLARLYWIPHGSDPRSGTYIEYPLDDLRGIVALASIRSRCVVIGEDLGTVPEGFREAMAETGILSYRILFFERDGNGDFIAPEAYPALALAASGTHDLATIPAWLRGEDVELRDRLALLETPLEDERAARGHDRERFLDALTAHGDLAPSEREDEIAVVVAANRYLAASPCAIVMAQLDDILGERSPVNIPGTSTQYPNWRRKLAATLESLSEDPRLTRLCNALNELRPRIGSAQ
ncbi:MAG TPA: 4-alpha-glucanotransferase [Candidatus Acidoferrum sp.]|nr:4-alpha-glucanotransferase [Candidatus Acidoferrum sp.]